MSFRSFLLALALILDVLSAVGQDMKPALEAVDPKDYAEAAELFRTLAEQGDAVAQAMVGSMYKEGMGVPKNAVEASRWTRMAADQGLAMAQFTLGFLYYKGEGVPQDRTEAARWIRLAADQGYVEAQFNLGLLFTKGEGVPQNWVHALAWMTIAAASGYDKAREFRDLIRDLLTLAQVSRAEDLSMKIWERIEASK